MTTMPKDVVARLPEEWAQAMRDLGEKPYRAKQIFHWLHQRGVCDPDAMTDLSHALRAQLKELGVGPRAEVREVREAEDGTRKLLFSLREDTQVECVIIPMTPLAGPEDADAEMAEESEEPDTQERTRVTLCISTQFGCAMGCRFCASGQAGLLRGLSAAEIVAQVQRAREHLRPDEILRNLVYMGMGEPLHHYEETKRSIELLTHPEGGAMSPRRITVSTVGLVPQIKRLGEDFGGKVGLAVSLHAPDDATRDRIMPMNQRYSMAALRKAMAEYPLPPRRRITIEYTLIEGVNSSLEQARKLAAYLKGLRVKINLIPMNPIGASDLRAPSEEQVREFRDFLFVQGFSCFVRGRRGADVDAACGQLALAEDVVRLRARRSAALEERS
jgi:23S rRNA (adenine2503-C2)-methyltransferase